MVAGSNPVTPTGQMEGAGHPVPSLLPMATFYILYSRALDMHYFGHTAEPIDERLRKHLSRHTGWTARATDWQVVYTEVFPDKAAAYHREREVKAWKNRRQVEELIAAQL